MNRSKQGQAPYGFRWQGGQLLSEEEVVQTNGMAFELFLKLKSMGAVARGLNAANRLTRRGGAWSDVQVGRILTCSSAIGRYEIGRSEQGPAGKRVAMASEERSSIECPMIVTKAVWEKAQAILLEKSKAPEKENSTHLFTGMVWCHCGQKMKGVSEGAKLDCPACHGKIPAGDLEAIFVDDFFDVTSNCPSLAAAMSAPSERRELQAELVDVSTALEEAKAAREGVEPMLTSSSISQKRFEELHGPLEKKVRNLEFRLHAVQKKLAGNSPPGFSLPEWQKQWAAWPVKRKRQLLSTFVGRVTVHAGEIEIAYLLSDSPVKTPPHRQRPCLRQKTSNPVPPAAVRYTSDFPNRGSHVPSPA